MEQRTNTYNILLTEYENMTLDTESDLASKHNLNGIFKLMIDNQRDKRELDISEYKILPESGNHHQEISEYFEIYTSEYEDDKFRVIIRDLLIYNFYNIINFDMSVDVIFNKKIVEVFSVADAIKTYNLIDEIKLLIKDYMMTKFNTVI